MTRRSMTRNQNQYDGASSSRKKPKTCIPWSDLDNDLLHSVVMQLGLIDYYTFRGVCKSWRSLACSLENAFMASIPPMSITISTDFNEKECFLDLEDFEGRMFKTILPYFAGGDCIGFTCGYLIFLSRKTYNFWLVNPITRKEFHFPDFPIDYDPSRVSNRAILVFSASISGWVFVMLSNGTIWVSIKGAWNRVSHTSYIADLYPFKGKIYTLSYNPHDRTCELRLSPQPKLALLKIMTPPFFHPTDFVCLGEKLYAIRVVSKVMNSLHELDVNEMKWVKMCEKKMEEYAFFRNNLNHVIVAVNRESWADLRSWSNGRYIVWHNTDNNSNKYKLFTAMMWYFPHECTNVDYIEE